MLLRGFAVSRELLVSGLCESLVEEGSDAQHLLGLTIMESCNANHEGCQSFDTWCCERCKRAKPCERETPFNHDARGDTRARLSDSELLRRILCFHCRWKMRHELNPLSLRLVFGRFEMSEYRASNKTTWSHPHESGPGGVNKSPQACCDRLDDP